MREGHREAAIVHSGPRCASCASLAWHLLLRHLRAYPVEAWCGHTPVSAHISLAAVVAAPGLGLALCLVVSGQLPTQTRMHLISTVYVPGRAFFALFPVPVLTCIKRVRRSVRGHHSHLPVVRPFVRSLRRCTTASELLASKLLSFPHRCGVLPSTCGSMPFTRIAASCFLRPKFELGISSRDSRARPS